MPLCLLSWSDFAQSIVSNWLADGIVVGAGALLTFLKFKKPAWLNALMYGLAGSALVAVIFVCLVGLTAIPRGEDETTAKNVEGRIRAWADTFGMATKKDSRDDSFFVIILTLHSGTGVIIRRPKSRERYIEFDTNIAVSPEHEQIIKNLSEEQSQRIFEEVVLELARSKIGYSVSGPPISNMFLVKAVPVANLTEESFANDLDDIDSAQGLSIMAFRLAIENEQTRAPLKVHVH